MINQDSLQLEGLSRIVQRNEKYHCAMISGYLPEKKGSRQKQRKRHAKLLAELMRHNFFIVSLKGGWENQKWEIKKEERFFVVNIEWIYRQKEEILSLAKFSRVIVELGTKFKQKAILIIPCGALSGKSRAYLINTDNPTKKEYVGPGELGRFTGNMYNRAKRFSFTYNEKHGKGVKILGVHHPARSFMGQLVCRTVAASKLDDVSLGFLKGKSLQEWIIEQEGSVYKKALEVV